jgi:hypothetical protein
MPGGSVDVVKKVLAEKLAEAAACIAGFAGCSNVTLRVVPANAGIQPVADSKKYQCGLFLERRAARGSSEPYSKTMEWEFMTKKQIIFTCWKGPERISGQAPQDAGGAFADKLRV